MAAALVTAEPAEPAALLVRAAKKAATTRDRQLVAIATAYVNDDADLLDALARDHLSDHPDNILAAWIASQRKPNRAAVGTGPSLTKPSTAVAPHERKPTCSQHVR